MDCPNCGIELDDIDMELCECSICHEIWDEEDEEDIDEDD